VVAGAIAGAQHGVHRQQRRPGLEHVAALGELRVQHLLELAQPAAVDQFRRERGGTVGALANQRARQADAEQPEARQQPIAHLGRDLGITPRPQEAVDRQQLGLQVVACRAGQRGERGVLGLPQRPSGLREQAGDGDDVLAEPAHRRVGTVPGGDATRGEHRVDAPARRSRPRARERPRC
jgi:hypothetical protein